MSLWRAMQTQSWRAENAAGSGEPQYSKAAIRHLVALLTEHGAAWERFFARHGGAVLELTYEDVASDLPGTLGRTLAHIGVAAPAGVPARVPRMRRQADERSDAWADAYVSGLSSARGV